jgi:hypothetical protein
LSCLGDLDIYFLGEPPLVGLCDLLGEVDDDGADDDPDGVDDGEPDVDVDEVDGDGDGVTDGFGAGPFLSAAATAA